MVDRKRVFAQGDGHFNTEFFILLFYGAIDPWFVGKLNDCYSAQIVEAVNGVALCSPNPCGNSSSFLPHPSSLGDLHFTAVVDLEKDDICHAVGKTEDCVTVIDKDYDGEKHPLGCKEKDIAEGETNKDSAGHCL